MAQLLGASEQFITPDKLLFTMKNDFTIIGQARSIDNSLYTFLSNPKGDLYLHYDVEMFLQDPYPVNYIITLFVSRTVFFGTNYKIRFHFASEPEKSIQKMIAEKFPKKDESLVKFIRQIEDGFYDDDLEQFRDCQKIVSKILLKDFGKKFISFYDSHSRYYLLDTVFDDDHGSFLASKMFLQIVVSDGESG
jgi:hypothetical protein